MYAMISLTFQFYQLSTALSTFGPENKNFSTLIFCQFIAFFHNQKLNLSVLIMTRYNSEKIFKERIRFKSIKIEIKTMFLKI